MYSDDDNATIGVIIGGVIIGALVLWFIFALKSDCERRGGRLVEGFVGPECVAGAKVLDGGK